MHSFLIIYYHATTSNTTKKSCEKRLTTIKSGDNIQSVENTTLKGGKTNENQQKEIRTC